MKTSHCALALFPLLLTGCITSSDPQLTATAEAEAPPKDRVSERISYYAGRYEVPESLVRRSVQIESGFNPNSRNGPYWGLMQIRPDTAKSMGYHGAARGLLDADTNLKYSVAYLSNAYVVAGGNPDRALHLYASGYFFEARRKHMLDQLRTAEEDPPTTPTPPEDIKP
jgi:soluble lytic murein transglycosylase-like protein